MTGLVVLDVVIGLVFVFLLYSLLGTLLAEIIATNFGLRARNLKTAVDRMLNDEQSERFLKRLWRSLRILRNPRNSVINNFYDHHEIKYLGSAGIFKKPSYFKRQSFSKVLIDLIDRQDGENIDQKLKNASEKPGQDSSSTGLLMGGNTIEYVRGLLKDAGYDTNEFKAKLEDWFDNTMEQATEWYKRKIQVILLVIGFATAWAFNVDTFRLVDLLSVDKSARQHMVELATAYSEQQNYYALDSTLRDTSKVMLQARLDTLLAVKQTLKKDIEKANSILGSRSWLPDELRVGIKQDSVLTYPAWVELDILPIGVTSTANGVQMVAFDLSDKLIYFIRLCSKHFFGYLLTALAISMGAPFWFDLLNKLVKLRSAVNPVQNKTSRS